MERDNDGATPAHFAAARGEYTVEPLLKDTPEIRTLRY